MKGRLGPRAFRWLMNLWPCYRGTGGRVTHIAADWSEIRVRLPLNWRTRNYVGSIFGGSLYGAVDPFFMLMLIHRLGPEYTVWDKAATIRFRKPGRGVLHATFTLDDGELAAVQEALLTEPKVDRNYRVLLSDAEGTVHAEVEKTVHISRRCPAQT
ncbi:MAG: DUF4442 domain-containing protein [Acidobacteria bacterium]|nr:DUF4442 domain-containing protein [Acidobacteriota bacterium]